MDADYYIVMVQDIGELLEYEFADYYDRCWRYR